MRKWGKKNGMILNEIYWKIILTEIFLMKKKEKGSETGWNLIIKWGTTKFNLKTHNI